MELLRCACDQDSLAEFACLVDGVIYELARTAYCDIRDSLDLTWTPETFRFTWLEAAQCVEEGSYP